MVFIKLDHSLLLVFILDYHRLYWKCLVYCMNTQRMKCEKTQIKNLFESIQDEDVTYSIVFENITAEETEYVQSVCIAFFNVFL